MKNNPKIICPVCGNKLYYVKSMWMVCDGNTVFQCENNTLHRFWRNSREPSNILHLNKNASKTSFDSEMDYDLNNNIYSVL